MDKAAKPLRLKELRWQEFRARVPGEYDAVVIPVGTVEAHGVIPLGTDIIIPEYLADKLAARLGLVVAPAVNYGVTRALLAYPGSHTVSSAAFRDYVSDVFVGFGRMGFRKLVVVNGHGGHFDELKEAASRAFRETGLFTVVLHWWVMAPEACVDVYGAEGGHASAEETAAIQVAAPDLLDVGALAGLKAWVPPAGVFVVPFPRPASVKEAGRGMPDGDARKARDYLARIEEKCYQTVAAAFDGWREELGK